jgi:phospholipase D-like protein
MAPHGQETRLPCARRRHFHVLYAGKEKVPWILLVLILPILGLILWFFLGPRGK